MRVWLITGASRGLGLEIARLALAEGDRVVATARSSRSVTAALGTDSRLLSVTLDVTDEQTIDQAVHAALDAFGRIDVLVNNAGYGLLGAIEEVSADEVSAVYATNVFGLLAVTRAVLPIMRRQGSGRILNIGSVGGFAAGPGFGVYASTKFAVEGITEALAAEVAPLGISCTIVEPGMFRTDFLDPSSLKLSGTEIDAYASTVGQIRSSRDQVNHQQLGGPVKAAEALREIVHSAVPPTRLQLGTDCVERVERKLAHVRTELDRWRWLAESTDQPEDS